MIDKVEALNHFLDETNQEMSEVINENPTKVQMLAYIKSWQNTINTIKQVINE